MHTPHPKSPVLAWQVTRALFSGLDSKQVLTFYPDLPCQCGGWDPIETVFIQTVLLLKQQHKVSCFTDKLRIMGTAERLFGSDDSVDWTVLFMSVTLEATQHRTGAQQGSRSMRVGQNGP